jgi:hypothetical protein
VRRITQLIKGGVLGLPVAAACSGYGSAEIGASDRERFSL